MNGWANSNTYPFNGRKHMHSWVSISIQVWICINHIRIDIRSCVVIMVLQEGQGDIVLVVATSCISLLSFRL